MEADDTINLVRYLRIISKRKMLISLIVIASVISAIVVTLLSPKTYKTSSVIQLSNPQISLSEETESGKGDENLRIRTSASYLVETATSDLVLSKVASRLRLGVPVPELRAKIQASLPELSNFLTITVNYGNPQGAALIANTLAEELVKQISKGDLLRKNFLVKKSKQVQGELQEVEKRRKLAEEILNQSKVDLTLSSGDRIMAQAQALQVLSSLSALTKDLAGENQKLQARLLELGETKISKAAEVPRKPNEHPLSTNIAFAIVLGLTGGMAVAFLAEFWQKSS